MIDVNRIVGVGFPPDEGIRLAKVLLDKFTDWSSLHLDLKNCDCALLISAFFNSFLQTVFEIDPTKLEHARKIKWEARYEFQKNSVEEWMRDFQPMN